MSKVFQSTKLVNYELRHKWFDTIFVLNIEFDEKNCLFLNKNLLKWK